MSAEADAGEAALADLLGLGIPAAPARALAGAMSHGAQAMLELVDAHYRERAAHPQPWATFHRVMAERLPRWRVVARAHHRRLARRYQAMVDAGTATVCEVTR